MRTRRRRILGLAGCAVALVASGWARKPGDPILPGRNLFSKFHDIQIGQAAAVQVRQRYPVVQDQFAQDYLQRIGARLAATPEARQSGFAYSFTLLAVPQVNAFALPGGPMFVFTGLLNATENEAQLAGVMAHEMSHVILRHSTHEASKAEGVQVLTRLLGAAAAAQGPATAQLARLGLGFGANSVILHFSREAESEADLLGSHLMSESGYNPIEMARFFEKLSATGSPGLQFFSDHPNPENRERAIETEIRALPQREYGYQTGDFARARAEALTAALGNRPAGSGPGAPPPSGPALPPPAAAFQPLQTEKFTLAFPANWNAARDAESSLWTLAPPEGLVTLANRPPQISYGILAGYFSSTFGNADLGASTLELVAYLHRDRPGMRLSQIPQQKARVEGAEALLTGVLNQSPAGGAETDLLLTVTRPGGVFFLLCTAPQRAFPQYQDTFQQVFNSIRFPR